MAKQPKSLHDTFTGTIKIDSEHAFIGWHKQYVANFNDNTGTLPTPAMWAIATATCKSAPGVECVNVACALRPEGVTVRQYLVASGAMGAAHNHLKALTGNESGNVFEGVPRRSSVKYARLTQKGVDMITPALITAGVLKAPKAVKAAIKAVAKAKVKLSAKANKKAAEAVAKAAEAVMVAGDTAVSVPFSDGETVAATEALQQLADHFNS